MQDDIDAAGLPCGWVLEYAALYMARDPDAYRMSSMPVGRRRPDHV
jgi:hypothetical protein